MGELQHMAAENWRSLPLPPSPDKNLCGNGLNGREHNQPK